MLTGYTDRLSARPKERISFMVSTTAKQFHAEIVRLFNGDSDSRGPGRREVPVVTQVTGDYSGTEQPLRPGSYIEVADHERLRLTGSFTIFAWIRPTRLGSHQSILSKGDSVDTGYGLGLTEAGKLYLRIGARQIEGAQSVVEGRWIWVAATYEASSGVGALRAQLHALDLSVVGKLGVSGRLPSVSSSAAALMMAASMKNCRPSYFYNGLIASPCLFAQCLTAEEMEAFAESSHLGALPPSCIAAWDFSLAADSTEVRDVAGGAFHGVTRQTPVRAMTGPHWAGACHSLQATPALYSGIHFHEDSLSDAQWVASFVFEIPADLPSGVYAARLTADNETDYLPFFVVPPHGNVNARIALLIPTFTYLAYGNELGHDYGLNCVYDRYIDGAGVPFASVRHPLKTFRPDRGLLKSTAGQYIARHFCADLYLINWLDMMGQSIDVITDHELHRDGSALLKSYAGVITGSHPEYVSARILDAVSEYLSGGGSLAYLGGNGFYSVTTQCEESGLIEVRRPSGSRPWSSNPGEGYHAMTGELGGLWRFRGRSPQALTGVGFTAQGWTSRGDECGLPRPYVQTGNRQHPLAKEILKGVAEGEAIGDFETLGLGIGAAGDEIDREDRALGTPAQTIVLATATGFSDEYQLVVEERLEINEASTRIGHPLVRADMVCFETGRGGFVFSVGSMQWSSALHHNKCQNSVATISHNAINLMLR